MRKFSSNLAFVDLLFNLLVGFTSMFIIAFLLINPIAEVGKDDPKVELLIVAQWDKESDFDMDLWVRGPDGSHVSYTNKDNGYMSLNRDDLGARNDTFLLNGEQRVHKRNVEDIRVRGIVPGVYHVTIHQFASGQNSKDGVAIDARSMTTKVRLLDINPGYKRIVEVEIDTIHRAEKHAFSFEVDEGGNVTNVRTGLDIQIRSSLATDYEET